MKTYSIVFGLVGLCLVADSLSINNFKRINEGPCPANFTGNIPNPEDCHSFYICDSGLGTLLPCPLDLCFNPAAGEGEGGGCDHCDLVPGCQSATGAPTTPSKSTTSTQAPTTTETQRPSTNPTQAPSSTLNPTPETTTQASSSTSQASSTTQKTTTPDSGEDLPCPSDVPYVYLPYPGDCSKFYYCIDGVNTGVFNCGADLWFRYKFQVCDFPWGPTCESDN